MNNERVKVEYKGVTVEVNTQFVDDIEFLEMLGEIERGNALVIPSVCTTIFGEDGYKAVKDGLRDADGRCRTSDVSEFLANAMQMAGEHLKN